MENKLMEMTKLEVNTNQGEYLAVVPGRKLIFSSSGNIKIKLFDKEMETIGVLFCKPNENVFFPGCSDVNYVAVYNNDNIRLLNVYVMEQA